MEKEQKEVIEDEKEEEIKKGVNKVLVCLIILVFLIGIYVVITKLNKENDAKAFKEEYSQVEENNVFVYKSIDEVIETLESGTGVIYFGFPECKWCQAYVPMLDEVAKENGIKEIYYFNIREDRTNKTEKYQKITTLLKDVLDKDEEGNPRVFVPEIIVVVDGKIMGHNNETALITDSTLVPEDYWTEEKTNELKVSLKELIIKVNSCIDCNE